MICETHQIDEETREACFSEDMMYRYRLTITWDSSKKGMTAICLNPSTATHLVDDPTVRKCKTFAKQFGCGSFTMLNCFAYRSTAYQAIFNVIDPIGPENMIEYLRHWTDGTLTIAAWGAHITERLWRHYYRAKDIATAIPNLQCLRMTKSGHPEHPCYLPLNLQPVPFRYA